MGFLTLNGIVSTLAGISKAALILPISEAISQLKWQWFWNLDRPRPISDFQIYDSASRGPWGSLCLLARPRLAHLSSLGAILTVVALAIEPFFQLVPSYPVRMMPTGRGLATVPVASLFTQIERDPIDFNTVTAGQGLKGATYDGLFDMLREISPGTDGLGDTKGWELPNGNTEYGASATYMVQGNGAVLPQKNGGQDFGNWTIAYSNMQNFTLFTAQSWYWAPLTGNTNSPPHASECILHFCLRTYNASVNDGIFSESIISQWPDPLQPLPKSITDQWGFGLLREMTDLEAPDNGAKWWQHAPDNISEANITLASPQMEGQVYTINWLTMFGLRKWFAENWWVATTDQDFTSDVAQVMYNAYTGPSRATIQPENTSAALAAVAAMPGPAGLWSDVADSMTRHIRDQASDQQSAHGVAYAAQTFVSVQWEWIILPISLLILTLAFVALTVAQSVEKEIPLWKSNSMPSLVYSFDETTSHSISGHGRTGEDMEQHAKAFEMAMRATSGSLKLRARPRNTSL
ncbi:hypothetical protein CBER1_06383 [Cercospora berteroae]|uniref:Uncharacterized protein n=1 Tax=Cercospora berteroae TaxID=357750 RepID=A0A2S6C926_9PEZI|nr:hypothetical protein CBER1_06383 [Cercospora berteroae]